MSSQTARPLKHSQHACPNFRLTLMQSCSNRPARCLTASTGMRLALQLGAHSSCTWNRSKPWTLLEHVSEHRPYVSIAHHRSARGAAHVPTTSNRLPIGRDTRRSPFDAQRTWCLRLPVAGCRLILAGLQRPVGGPRGRRWRCGPAASSRGGGRRGTRSWCGGRCSRACPAPPPTTPGPSASTPTPSPATGARYCVRGFT